ncbi:ABC transporter permease [Tsukamurella asaccharolytica]|uniref:ABC transporter permease n=1 Tax=Tsukamurella asaccharolytica TaxID=2592067 RepID=A0A5C5R6M1_9ACTN|nr:ABC transporter permease [Tsukamurella asaccharolytica]TWS18356.1 ABC transporter permease [Tsukamurella asaccharolytica]
MTAYLLRRVPTALLVLLLASVLIFGILRFIPGGPEAALLGPDASPSDVQALRHELGLDRSFFAQYLTWISSILRLDFGRSYQVGGEISALISFGLVNTLVLTGAALLVAVVLAVGLALAVTVFDNRWLSAVVTGVNAAAIAIPTFVLGTLLVLLAGVRLRWLPAGGAPPDGYLTEPTIAVQYLILPAITLGLPTGAMLARFLTESLHTELGKPYAVTARSLGVSQRRIVLRHALRNALPATVTAFGLLVGGLLGGAILVETVFGYPGLGMLTEQGIFSRDYPLVQVLLLLSVTVFIVVQLLADVAHAWLDPRIRLGARS